MKEYIEGVVGWLLMTIPMVYLVNECWSLASSYQEAHVVTWILGTAIWVVGTVLIIKSFFTKKVKEVKKLEEE